jgi:O-antigen/teichoic acid export membrane protein
MSLKKNLVANFVGQGWSGLIGIVFIPLYIRYLGMESFALIGVYAILQAWLILLDMGMSTTLNREMARYTAGAHTPQSICNLLRSLECLGALVAILVGAFVWTASNWLAGDWLREIEL